MSEDDEFTRYVSEDGRVITKENIGYYVRYENATIEQVEDGLLFDGELYRPIEE